MNAGVRYDFVHMHVHEYTDWFLTPVGDTAVYRVRSAERAWVYNQDYALARGLQQDTVDCKIAVPTDVLEGDYHFMLRLTDRAGWQAIKTVPIHLHELGE